MCVRHWEGLGGRGIQGPLGMHTPLRQRTWQDDRHGNADQKEGPEDDHGQLQRVKYRCNCNHNRKAASVKRSAADQQQLGFLLNGSRSSMTPRSLLNL